MATNNKSGLFVGLNKGQTSTLPAKQTWKSSPVTKKGKLSNRAKAVREVVREIAAKEKKAVKHARAKLGTHRRALIKKQDLVNLIQAAKEKKAVKHARAKLGTHR